MSSKRRKEYQPSAKFPVYSKAFNELRMSSEILNPNPRPSIRTIFWDKATLKSELVKIISEQKPALQEKLDNLQYRFQNLKTDCRNQGREIPTEMPFDLLNEKYKIEAAQDICEEEKELIQERLKTFTDKVVKEVNENMLRNGLQCQFHYHGLSQPDDKLINVMKEIDGQTVSMCPEKILIINDEASIYNGMSLPEYRKLSKIWHQDRMKADEALLIRMQAEAKAKGEEKPYATGQSFNRNVSKSALPPFPSWAKHYSMQVIEEDEEVTYTRKPKYKNSK